MNLRAVTMVCKAQMRLPKMFSRQKLAKRGNLLMVECAKISLEQVTAVPGTHSRRMPSSRSLRLPSLHTTTWACRPEKARNVLIENKYRGRCCLHRRVKMHSRSVSMLVDCIERNLSKTDLGRSRGLNSKLNISRHSHLGYDYTMEAALLASGVPLRFPSPK